VFLFLSCWSCGLLLFCFGCLIFDRGQKLAGWVRMHVKGPAGYAHQNAYGNLMNKDGSLNGLTAVVGMIKGGEGQLSIQWRGDAEDGFELDQIF